MSVTMKSLWNNNIVFVIKNNKCVKKRRKIMPGKEYYEAALEYEKNGEFTDASICLLKAMNEGYNIEDFDPESFVNEDKYDVNRIVDFLLELDNDDAHPLTLIYIGHVYQYGFSGKERDIERAKSYFRRAMGSANLSVSSGSSVPKEPKGQENKSFISAAFIALGDVYCNEGDYEEAIKQYEEAYKKGNVKGLIYIGIIYTRYKRDFWKAREYYKKAIREGCDEALYKLFVLYNDVGCINMRAPVMSNTNITFPKFDEDIPEETKKGFQKKAQKYLDKAVKLNVPKALIHQRNLCLHYTEEYFEAIRLNERIGKLGRSYTQEYNSIKGHQSSNWYANILKHVKKEEELLEKVKEYEEIIKDLEFQIMEFNHRPGNIGAKKAEEHFNGLLSSNE